ncbi:uncharacterized protein LOC109726657 [Ananas comosus]|uniref:Uncharacterized protein LOC109726657 n=1 Tax=Ananas comosus TaxID=4615 RepID=A0A6P5GVS3_ANACO|nr:uncharacterized protein LOC109726657 [Ananas comosus]
MNETSELRDWELLQASCTSPPLRAPLSAENPSGPFEAADDADSEDGAIKPDYFAPDSRHLRRHAADEDDSDNPSWVDPDPDFRSGAEAAFAGSGFPVKNYGGFWSDDSSEVDGFEGIDGGGDRSLGSDGESGRDLRRAREVFDEMPRRDGGSGGGERKGVVWWKMPLEMLRCCAFKMKPFCYISIAAAVVGLFMLGRSMYKLKQKGRGVSLRLAMDDKIASHFAVRAARLNKAFSAVRRVPILRTSPPASGMTPWSMLPLR